MQVDPEQRDVIASAAMGSGRTLGGMAGFLGVAAGLATGLRPSEGRGQRLVTPRRMRRFLKEKAIRSGSGAGPGAAEVYLTMVARARTNPETPGAAGLTRRGLLNGSHGRLKFGLSFS